MRRVPFQPYDPTEEPKGRSTPGAKRKPPRAGRRSVTTLTAAQLERKRANDREAQRTTRQRTKDYIDQLEHQVADLQGAYQDPESKLMEVVHRNNELRSENAMLKGKLSHALWALDHYVTSSAFISRQLCLNAPSRVPSLPCTIADHPNSCKRCSLDSQDKACHGLYGELCVATNCWARTLSSSIQTAFYHHLPA